MSYFIDEDEMTDANFIRFIESKVRWSKQTGDDVYLFNREDTQRLLQILNKIQSAVDRWAGRPTTDGAKKLIDLVFATGYERA